MRAFRSPEGGSIKVLIRTQGERLKVVRDEGCSNRKLELIVFPSSRLIAVRDLTWVCGETWPACNKMI